MECLKLCVAFGLASVARGSAAVGPLSYLLQYKRSVLSNPTGLAAFNGFGGTPFGLAAYDRPGLGAYGLDAGHPFVVHYGPSPQFLYAQQPTAGPTVAAESAAPRFQSPPSQQPAAAVPDLFLELRPPHYSEPPIDYSKSPGPPPVGFGPAYLVASIPYALPTNTYSHTEPNAVRGGPGVPAGTAPDVPNDVASNAPSYGGGPGSGGPGPGSFPDAYGDSNSVRSSGSRGNDKPARAGNVRAGDPKSSADKRETQHVGRPDNSPPMMMSYFGGDYKNVQRDDAY